MAAISAETIAYLQSLLREGDDVNYFAWLRRVRAGEVREKAVYTVPQRTEVAANPAEPAGGVNESTGRATPVFNVGFRQIERKTEKDHHQKPNSETRSNSIRERLLRVCDASDDFQESRARDGVYSLLTAAYRVVMHYEGRRGTRRLLRRAFKFAGLAYDKHADPFSTVIRCTCERSLLDNKTISKWARALRYAAHRKRAPRRLKSFIKALGGVNACADQYAKILGRLRGRV